MSIDDLLYSPIGGSDSGWRKHAQRIIDYMTGQKHAPSGHAFNLTVPPLALKLMEMCELHHEFGQEFFYLVTVYPATMASKAILDIREIYFDGDLVLELYEDGKYPHMRQNPKWSLRDINLVGGGYTRHFVFPDRPSAEDYYNYITDTLP